MDVTTATDAAGSRAIELANARAALQDALDRAENLGHVSLPPESACWRSVVCESWLSMNVGIDVRVLTTYE